MSRKIKNVLIGEILFLIIAQIIVLLVIVGRGILFGVWYKEYDNILLFGIVVYLFLLFLRGLIRVSKRMRKRASLNSRKAIISSNL